jgi:4-amino-4-deoxy-L-arabinose transferase-like glycosyltransferase
MLNWLGNREGHETGNPMPASKLITRQPHQAETERASKLGWIRAVLEWEFLLPCVLLVIATAAYFPDRTSAADNVESDSPNYVVPCLNFIAGKGMVWIVNGVKYPPYHTVGLSLLMTPFYLLLGQHPGNGVYLIFLTGLATVLLLFVVGKRLFGTATAFVACLFLCTAEAFRVYSASIWSDVPSACFCLAAYLFVLMVLDRPRSSFWLWFALGQTIGYAIMIRPDNAVILVPIAVLVMLRRKNQEKILQKIFIAASGLIFWGIILLITNFLYTGDVFRSQVQVTTSGAFDRPDHGFSWRFLFKSPRPDYPFGQLIRAAHYQWSLGETTAPMKRIFCYGGDALLVLGLIQSILFARRDRKVRDFLLWTALWTALCILFVGCSLFEFDNRYMQRVVPYLCLLNGAGFVAAWNGLLKLSSPLRKFFRGISPNAHPRLWSYAVLFQLRLVLLAGLVTSVAWMWFHVYAASAVSMATTTYLKHVVGLIQEPNALVICNFDSTYSAYFFGTSDQWTLLPLDRGAATDQYVQWKKPAHPEWITEDFGGEDWFPYKRMFQNGAEYIFPKTALDDPDIVDSAIASGIPVYLVFGGIYTDNDFQAMGNLANRYALKLTEFGLTGLSDLPKEAQENVKKYFFGQLVPKGSNLGTSLRIETSAGPIQFEP